MGYLGDLSLPFTLKPSKVYVPDALGYCEDGCKVSGVECRRQSVLRGHMDPNHLCIGRGSDLSDLRKFDGFYKGNSKLQIGSDWKIVWTTCRRDPVRTIPSSGLFVYTYTLPRRVLKPRVRDFNLRCPSLRRR